jgi:hypothetical protein
MIKAVAQALPTFIMGVFNLHSPYVMILQG